MEPEVGLLSGVPPDIESGRNVSGFKGSQQATAQPRDKRTDVTPDDDRDVRRRLGMVGRIECAQRIAIARAQLKPVPWQRLARQEGLSERQCRRIHDDYISEGLRLGDPLNMVRESLSLLNRSITVLGDIAEGEAHDSIKIGALRLLTETLGARISLMVAAGLMPRRLTQQRDRDDAVAIVRRMALVIQSRDLDPEVIDELLAVVDAPLELQPTGS